MKVIISYTLCTPDKTANVSWKEGPCDAMWEKNVDCTIEDTKGSGKCNEHDFANLSVGQRMYQLISVVGLPIWVTTHETRPLPRLWREITSMPMPPRDSCTHFEKSCHSLYNSMWDTKLIVHIVHATSVTEYGLMKTLLVESEVQYVTEEGDNCQSEIGQFS
jgi:hypothetical protein